jgi:histone-lysine N-methyltransferase SETD2
MSTWPLISRNKVEDSKVNVPVERCIESENVVLKKASQDVRAAVFFTARN